MVKGKAAKKKYKIQLLEDHRKVRDEERRETLDKHGNRSKFLMAFVGRRNKKAGKLFQFFIDPVTAGNVVSSSEAYTLPKESVADLEAYRRSTALNILTAPQNKVDYRWVTREMVREIRRMARRGDATVLITN